MRTRAATFSDAYARRNNTSRRNDRIPQKDGIHSPSTSDAARDIMKEHFNTWQRNGKMFKFSKSVQKFILDRVIVFRITQIVLST